MDATTVLAHSQPIDPRPTLHISTRALRSNLAYIRTLIGPSRQIFAVVKANAYGHGVDVVAPAVRDQVDGFVVVSLDEAHTLRALPGLTDSAIVVLNPIDPILHSDATIERAVRDGLTLFPATVEAVHAIADVADRLGRVCPILLHIDTGMRRCGADLATADTLARAILERRSLRWQHASTHCAHQDLSDPEFTERQLAAFRAFVDQWKPVVPGLIAHAAASSLTLRCPKAVMDAVRIGAAMYGIDPIGVPDAAHPIQPAMKLTAPIVAVRDVRPGDGVGYSHTFVARRTGRVAILPVGYFDGVPRASSNKAKVMIGGVACPTIGIVSMDLLIVDVSRCPAARVGEIATIIDDDAFSPAAASAWARASSTCTYEIAARIGPRARRVTDDTGDVKSRRPTVQVDVIARSVPQRASATRVG